MIVRLVLRIPVIASGLELDRNQRIVALRSPGFRVSADGRMEEVKRFPPTAITLPLTAKTGNRLEMISKLLFC